MNSPLIVATLLLCLSAAALARASGAPRIVSVCIGRDLPYQNRANSVAAALFASIGIRIAWKSLSGCPADAIKVELTSSSGRISGQTPPPGVLASAHPFEGTRIVIFFDRVKNAVMPNDVPALLGYVIAHEVAHILEGTTHHARSGIMKARWSAEDLKQMGWGPLGFTPEDRALINLGLEARQRTYAPQSNIPEQSSNRHGGYP